ncbi:hypothetical protein N7475_004286 [Penicillium sp. IBT 31633x]|nr:hypothetical protein N7475_004286 [Penicillium sp. IBT 31633x]
MQARSDRNAERKQYGGTIHPKNQSRFQVAQSVFRQRLVVKSCQRLSRLTDLVQIEGSEQ